MAASAAPPDPGARHGDSDKWYNSNVFASAVGAFGAIVGGVVAVGMTVWLNEAKEDKQAQKSKAITSATIDAQLVLAQRHIMDSRTAYVTARSLPRAARSLRFAETAVFNVEEALADAEKRLSLDRKSLLTDLGYTEFVLPRMRACIYYHTAKLALLEGNVTRARKYLASGDRHLAQGAVPLQNEFKRITIKLGDADSFLLQLHDALTSYAMALEGTDAKDSIAWKDLQLSQLDTFWAIRAVNHAALANFNACKDHEAAHLMKLVCSATDKWLGAPSTDGISCWHGVPVPAGFADMFGDVRKHAESHSSAPHPAPTEAELRVINLGADNAVDIFYLKHAPAALPHAITAAEFATPQTTAVALEYVERLQLLLRKHCSARANAVAFACAPFSAAQSREERAKGLWFQLDRLVQPLAGMAVYAQLDAEWARGNGAARMLTAAGWALTELLLVGAIPQELHTRVATEANHLLASAGEAAPQVNSTPWIMNRLARARLQLVGGRDSRSEKDALHELRDITPALLLAQPPFAATRAAHTVTKHARWYLEAAALTLDLQSRRHAATAAEVAALRQALGKMQEAVPLSHPLQALLLRVEAGTTAPAATGPAAAVVSEQEVRAMLGRVERWSRGWGARSTAG